MKAYVGWVALFALVCAPVLAIEPEGAEAGARVESLWTDPAPPAAISLCRASKPPTAFTFRSFEPGTLAVCTANCWNGSTVTCTGTSCTAVDSNCPDEEGYCWSNAEGYKYCPACDCLQINCGCDGRSCSKSSQCGTCDGYQCVCLNSICRCP